MARSFCCRDEEVSDKPSIGRSEEVRDKQSIKGFLQVGFLLFVVPCMLNGELDFSINFSN